MPSEPDSMPKQRRTVLFVCTGNTCRSPLAEGLLKHALGDDTRFVVASSGISASEGSPAAGHTLSLLQDLDIDLGDHHSHQLDDETIEHSLLVIALTTRHRDAILRHRPDIAERLFLVTDFIPGEEGRDIPDPVGGPRVEYEVVRDSICAALPALLELLERLVPRES